MTRHPRPTRKGMTLVEVIVAVTILGGATLAMGAFLTQFSRTVTSTRTRNTAAQIAAERLEDVKASTNYDTLAILFPEASTPVAGYAEEFERTTFVQRVGSSTATVDYSVITVEVASPKLPAPVRRTTIITSF